MSGPPPPPPPPPPPSGLLPGPKSVPKPSNDRSKLLSEIQRGARLKKAVTNDRSAPLVGGTVKGGGGNGETSTPARAPLGLPSNNAGSGPVGLGGLFANGVPSKPSDVRNKKYGQAAVKLPTPAPLTPSSTSDNQSAPPLPPPKLPSSKSNSSMANSNFASELAAVHSRREASVSANTTPTPNRLQPRVTHFPSHADSLPVSAVPPPKPPLKRFPPAEIPQETPKSASATKFSTLRSTSSANSVSSMRGQIETRDDMSLRSGRSNRPAIPPPSRPAVPPPPPPAQRPSGSGSGSEPPPPPPPPRGASAEVPAPPAFPLPTYRSTAAPATPDLRTGNSNTNRPFTNALDRFHFLRIEDLPPPEPFLGLAHQFS